MRRRSAFKRMNPVCIFLAVGAPIRFKRGCVLVVETVRRPAPEHGHGALVELQPDNAVDRLLGFVDERLHALRSGDHQ